MLSGFARAQDAYRKQHSCIQPMIRVVSQLQEAKAMTEYSVGVFLWILSLVLRKYGQKFCYSKQ